MPYLTLDKASLAFGHAALLDRVDFQLDEARVGRNNQRALRRMLSVSLKHPVQCASLIDTLHHTVTREP